MDGGIIVGYLVAFLLGGAKRFADRRLDRVMERLYNQVAQRLAGDSALHRLANDPQDEWSQRQVRAAIERLTRHDTQFADALTRLQRDLDHRGARNLLVYAPGAETVVGVNSGVVLRHGNVYIDRRSYRDPRDLSDAAGWVKTVVAIGLLLCLGGMAIFGYTMFTYRPEFGSADFGRTPPGIPLAFGVFFTGFVLAMVGGVAHGMTRKPH